MDRTPSLLNLRSRDSVADYIEALYLFYETLQVILRFDEYIFLSLVFYQRALSFLFGVFGSNLLYPAFFFAGWLFLYIQSMKQKLSCISCATWSRLKL